jgi:hypothetical protein
LQRQVREQNSLLDDVKGRAAASGKGKDKEKEAATA